MFVAASRTPEERRGDLDAQRGANRLGVERCARSWTRSARRAAARRGRRLRRAAHARGARRAARRRVARSRTCSTRPGPRPAQQSPTRIVVTLSRRAATRATFDFTGTDAQRPGNVNAVEAVTVERGRVRGPRGRPIRRSRRTAARCGRCASSRPPGTVVAAVAAGRGRRRQRRGEPARRRRVPRRARAGRARPGRCCEPGHDEQRARRRRRTWVYYETIGGGQGGRPGPTGMSGVHTAMTNTLRHAGRGARARAAAARAPLRRCGRGAVAPAPRAGGDGIERELEMLERRHRVAHHRTARVSAPWGLAGGEPGAAGENWLLPGGDESPRRALPDKCTVHARGRRRAAHPHARAAVARGRRRRDAAAPDVAHRPTSAALGASMPAASSTTPVPVVRERGAATSTWRRREARCGRRPAVMRCSRSATTTAVARSSRGSSESSRSSAAGRSRRGRDRRASTSAARSSAVGADRRRGRAGRATSIDRRRRRPVARRAASRARRASMRAPRPARRPPSSNASRSARFVLGEPRATRGTRRRDAWWNATPPRRRASSPVRRAWREQSHRGRWRARSGSMRPDQERRWRPGAAVHCDRHVPARRSPCGAYRRDRGLALSGDGPDAHDLDRERAARALVADDVARARARGAPGRAATSVDSTSYSSCRSSIEPTRYVRGVVVAVHAELDEGARLDDVAASRPSTTTAVRRISSSWRTRASLWPCSFLAAS